MKPTSIDNFQRFADQYPSYNLELDRLKKIINQIDDEHIQTKVYARVNVELGVVLLKNKEVGIALSRLLHMQFEDLNQYHNE